jgi:iron(III) transport system ATP-binding protein
VANGVATLDVDGEMLTMPADGLPAPGSPVNVVIRPESIAIEKSKTGPTAVVRTRTYLGDKIEYEVTFGGQTLTIVRFNPAEDEEVLPGTHVSLDIPAASIRLVAAAD